MASSSARWRASTGVGAPSIAAHGRRGGWRGACSARHRRSSSGGRGRSAASRDGGGGGEAGVVLVGVGGADAAGVGGVVDLAVAVVVDAVGAGVGRRGRRRGCGCVVLVRVGGAGAAGVGRVVDLAVAVVVHAVGAGVGGGRRGRRRCVVLVGVGRAGAAGVGRVVDLAVAVVVRAVRAGELGGGGGGGGAEPVWVPKACGRVDPAGAARRRRRRRSSGSSRSRCSARWPDEFSQACMTALGASRSRRRCSRPSRWPSTGSRTRAGGLRGRAGDGRGRVVVRHVEVLRHMARLPDAKRGSAAVTPSAARGPCEARCWLTSATTWWRRDRSAACPSRCRACSCRRRRLAACGAPARRSGRSRQARLRPPQSGERPREQMCFRHVSPSCHARVTHRARRAPLTCGPRPRRTVTPQKIRHRSRAFGRLQAPRVRGHRRRTDCDVLARSSRKAVREPTQRAVVEPVPRGG